MDDTDQSRNPAQFARRALACAMAAATLAAGSADRCAAQESPAPAAPEAMRLTRDDDGLLELHVRDAELSAVQTVQFLETGTQLRFRPFIGRDGWVRLELQPKDSNGGLTADNLPFEETTEITTNLLVRDGATVVIGGLFRESTVASKSVRWPSKPSRTSSGCGSARGGACWASGASGWRRHTTTPPSPTSRGAVRARRSSMSS